RRDRQARLADPAQSRDGEQADAATYQGRHVVELALPADEGGQERGQRSLAFNPSARSPDDGRVVPQDRLVKLTQPGPRFEPELFGQGAAGILVRLERVGLPSRTVERKHQL